MRVGTFRGFEDGTGPGRGQGIQHFLSQRFARWQRLKKRGTAKKKDTDNEKYAFRCFLLRLGFIGDEYKRRERYCIRNLSGRGAFKRKPKVQELVECINADAGLYDDVMSLQDKEVSDDEVSK